LLEREIEVLNGRIDSLLAANLGPQQAVRLAKTVSGAGYPTDPATVYPIMFLDGDFVESPGNQTPSLIDRSATSSRSAYSLSDEFINQGTVGLTWRQNGKYWFLPAGTSGNPNLPGVTDLPGWQYYGTVEFWKDGDSAETHTSPTIFSGAGYAEVAPVWAHNLNDQSDSQADALFEVDDIYNASWADDGNLVCLKDGSYRFDVNLRVSAEGESPGTPDADAIVQPVIDIGSKGGSSLPLLSTELHCLDAISPSESWVFGSRIKTDLVAGDRVHISGRVDKFGDGTNWGVKFTGLHLWIHELKANEGTVEL
jgi:hypothetical protein